LNDGFCTAGHCIRYKCVGECCDSARVAADGTPCANKAGTCTKGTCIVVEKKKEPKLSHKEKEAKKRAEKRIRSELETALNGLLKRQEKLIVRKERRKLMEQQAKESFLEKLSDVPIVSRFEGLTKKAVSNVADNSGNLYASIRGEEEEEATPFYKTNAFYVIIGLGCVVVALIVLFVVLGGGKNDKRKTRKERKPKSDESESELYEPPAF